MSYKLSEIAEKIGARLVLKSVDLDIKGFAPLEAGRNDALSFLSNPKYKSFLTHTQAGAVILAEDALDACSVNALVVKDPYVAFAKAAALFDDTPKAVPGIHPSAVIDGSVNVPASVSIGPGVVIEAEVVLGENVVIGAGSIIGAYAYIGADTILKPRVVLYHRVQIGQRCLIHAGAVIGSDGFGLANQNGHWLKVPQLGSVTLEDDIEIGANTTIDRGAIENTLIKQGVKIDNQVQIAHNVVIGEATAIAAQVGVAGSSQIGRHCLLGGKVGVNGHTRLADCVMVTAMSGVTKDIQKPGTYSASMPARPAREWNKFLAHLNRIEKSTGKKKNESN